MDLLALILAVMAGETTEQEISSAVSAWITAHPEAVTTVQDGAISRAKLDADLQEKTDAVGVLKSALIESESIPYSDMLQNKMYNIDQQGKWYLVDNNGTYYTDVLDLSEYIGGKIKITVDVLNTGGSRVYGFATDDKYLIQYWRERDTNIFHQNGEGKYEAIIDIITKNFIFSYTNSTGGVLTHPTLEIMKLDLSNKPDTVYVDGVNGNDTNTGYETSPFKTINRAILSDVKNILIKAGTYNEQVNIVGIMHDVKLALWQMPVYSSANHELPKIIIDGGSGRTINYGVYAENCGNVTISDIVCKNVAQDAFFFQNTQYVKCVSCFAINTTGNTMGFRLYNVNGIFLDCLADTIGKDGFNIHGYGNTEFINCVAHDCGDDGISHHEGCKGKITGGEYYNCTKGGVSSPTYGAEVDISGVYSHNNKYGLYAVADASLEIISKSRISDCVFKNNTDYDLYISKGLYIGWNNIYDTKNVFWNATFTELN